MKLVSRRLGGVAIYMVGIKGSGMAALAELLVQEGARLCGSDIPEEFYTDKILAKNDIAVLSGFASSNVPGDCDLVIYSAAYNPEDHPELIRARELGLRLLTYPQALGEYSASLPFAAVSGIHGKTTTSAIVGTLVKHLKLTGKVLVGSAVDNFDGSPVFSGGQDFFIAETCEYRRHFLNCSPEQVLITSIGADHLDYFRDEADVASAFCELMDRLPPGGTLVYCADDRGAGKTVETYMSGDSAGSRNLKAVPYGFSAGGRYGIRGYQQGDGVQRFSLNGYSPWLELRYPGKHSVLNAAGAIALLESLLSGIPGMSMPSEKRIAESLSTFSGTTRRSEIVADLGGVKIIDDYAHHPAAVKATLEGYRSFYPGRRIIVDFMSHTYSRSFALIEEFADCFGAADILLLNDIYASAREENSRGLDGRDFFRTIGATHGNAHYFPDFDEAADFLFSTVAPGDLVVTMGAGDNWRIGRILADRITRGAQQDQSWPTA